jgi:hypothetical protein
MTLFFDLHILERDSLHDYNYLVEALYLFYKGKTIPRSLRSKYKPLKTMRKGSSFLINPESLFSDKSVDNIYKAQYIKLAGRRDYINFKINGDKSLHLSLYPDVNLLAIKTNPLLLISNNKLYFKYEE